MYVYVWDYGMEMGANMFLGGTIVFLSECVCVNGCDNLFLLFSLMN